MRDWIKWNFASPAFCNFINFAFANYNTDIQIDVLEQDEQHVLINYTINDLIINEIRYNNEIFHDVGLLDEPNFIVQNSPKLPHVNRSFIIPESSYAMKVSIVTSEYVEYENLNIIPSKGNPKRIIDINSIPYKKGTIETFIA